ASIRFSVHHQDMKWILDGGQPMPEITQCPIETVIRTFAGDVDSTRCEPLENPVAAKYEFLIHANKIIRLETQVAIPEGIQVERLFHRYGVQKCASTLLEIPSLHFLGM